MLVGAGQVVYGGLIRAVPAATGNKANGLNQNIKVLGHKTKTMS